MSSNRSLIKKYKEIKDENLSSEQILKNTLIKKAKGFVVEEVVEEYSQTAEDSKLVLTKRKVATKEIPPDTNAIKYLLELESLNNNRFAQMTDEQLNQEKLRLLKLFEEEEDEIDRN